MTTTRLQDHLATLAAQRFCPMNVPACEVATATALESHALRARMVMLWRIAAGQAGWTARAAELLYEATLDSTSEAFDPYHAPFSRVLLDARADAWEAGVAPAWVHGALERHEPLQAPEAVPAASTRGAGPVLLVAGEAAYADADGEASRAALGRQGVDADVMRQGAGALAWLLGARRHARDALASLIEAVARRAPQRLIADGPQTAWWLRRGPALTGLAWPAGLAVETLAEALGPAPRPRRALAGPVFVHDTRPSCWLAGVQPDGRCIMPGYESRADADEAACGDAPNYALLRRLVDAVAPRRVWSVWTRALAHSCGSDDGLWATRPALAGRLARARLDHARALGAAAIVTDSPLAARWMDRHRADGDVAVLDLAALY